MTTPKSALPLEVAEPENRVSGAEHDVFIFPPSRSQEGFWFLDQLEPGNPAYNIAVRFRLSGPLNIAILERALNEIVHRHEVLRTTFDIVDGEPVQVVHPFMTVPFVVSDLRDLAGPDRDSEEDRLAMEEAGRRFDLSTGPLLRAQVLQLAQQDCVLLLTVHHIVSDGWSIGVITNELGAIYEALSRGLEAPLPDLPIQYADFAVWQRDSLDGPQMDAQLTYWKHKLAHLSSFDVPTDYPRTPHRTFNGSILSRLLPRPLTDCLRNFSVQQDCTFFMTSLAALKILLLHYSSQPDIHVGTLLAGRNRVETEPLIGPFINPLVLRTDLGGAATFVELLARVRATVLEAVANQDLPFERIVQALNPKRELNRHPMFDVNFIYQRDFVRPLQFAGVTLTAIPSRSPGAIYDLNFFMVERADGWRLSCEYNTDLFAGVTVERMLGQLQVLLESIAANPKLAISQVRLLMEQQRPEIQVDYGTRETRAQHGGAALLHMPFVASRDETEAKLVKIWQKLLGNGPVSVKANFFELGGHSLLAARLLAQVEKVFGRKLLVSVLFQAPTIEQLAAVIRDQNSQTAPPVVNALQPKGAKPPLFWMGGSPMFIPLANRLGYDRPFLGLPLARPQELSKPYRLEDIAASMVKKIRTLQPEGPYFLGGWCFAAVIAYEIARQLQEQGQYVGLLALVDATNPSYARRLSRAGGRLNVLSQKLRYHISSMRQLELRGACSYALDLMNTLLGRLTRRIYMLAYQLHLRAGVPLIPAIKNPGEVAHMASSSYHPKPYFGRVTLVRNVVRLTEPYLSRTLGWDELSNNVDVVECPGDHVTMFQEPNVAVMAEKLVASMEDGMQDRALPDHKHPAGDPTTTGDQGEADLAATAQNHHGVSIISQRERSA